MILSDDNFATIVQAVVNGRGVFTNIKNAIQFLLSGNMAGILCVVYASVMGLPVPFLPVHLLFINLLTDSLPAIAIGMEPARPGLLEQKPRDPKAPILDKPAAVRIFGQGALIAAATMAAFLSRLRMGRRQCCCHHGLCHSHAGAPVPRFQLPRQSSHLAGWALARTAFPCWPLPAAQLFWLPCCLCPA